MISRPLSLSTTFTLSAYFLLFALPFSVFTGFATRAEASNDTVVTQLIFSGRPDPQWTITDPVRQQLPGYLVGITLTSPPNWPAAGCRGFQVLNVDPSFTGFPALVRVFQGVIEIGGSYYGDLHGLESFLKSTIPTALDNNGNKIVDLCE